MTATGQDLSYLEQVERRYEKEPDFIAEELALDVTEQAARLMEAQGISRSRLAQMLNVSRSYVTRTFNAPPNLTLRTIAQLAVALGVTPTIRLDVPTTETVSEVLASESASHETAWVTQQRTCPPTPPFSGEPPAG